MTDQKPSLPIESSHSATRGKDLANLPLNARQPAHPVSKERIQTWYEYNGILGNVTVQNKSRFAGHDIRFVDAKSVSEEMVVILRPSFLKHYYDLRRMRNFSRISWTLNVDCVVDYKDPVFEMCRSGDILGLHAAFCGGRASPDAVNSLGMGLLHVSEFFRTFSDLTVLKFFSTLHIITS